MSGEINPEDVNLDSVESTILSSSSKFHSGVRFGGSFRANTTQAKPFSFDLKDRMILLSRKQREIDAVKQARKRFTAFRAQPMPVGPPASLPKPECPPLTTGVSPPLKTKTRAKKRASFESRLDAKRLSAERRMTLIRQDAAVTETKMVKLARKATVHRPLPVNITYNPPPNVPSKAVTRSRSFNFETKKRCRRIVEKQN